ncbi:hypothetical protein V6N13_106408 [Hibiscus sabdariffa]|uniref:Uncharacterized protein n=1 Tax=Hibiscus sabdariffa TaxID=183260 RepID=A0ABR2F0K9_9ROSI
MALRPEALNQKEKVQTFGREANGWWEDPGSKLNTKELEELSLRLEELHKQLRIKRKEKIAAPSSVLAPADPTQCSPFATNGNEDIPAAYRPGQQF